MSRFFENRRVTLTGGAGFLGRYVVQGLEERGCKDIFIPQIEEYDLVKPGDIERMYGNGRPDTKRHLVERYPSRYSGGEFFYLEHRRPK